MWYHVRLYAGSGDSYQGPHDYEASVFPIAPFPSQGEETKTQSTVLFHMHWLNYSDNPEFHGASLQSSQNRRDCLSVAAGYPLPFCPLLGTVGLLTVSPETERHRVQLETRVVTGGTESFLLSHASYSARLGCGTSFH